MGTKVADSENHMWVGHVFKRSCLTQVNYNVQGNCMVQSFKASYDQGFFQNFAQGGAKCLVPKY